MDTALAHLIFYGFMPLTAIVTVVFVIILVKEDWK